MDSHLRGNDIKRAGMTKGMMGLPRRYAPRNDRMKEHSN